MKRILSFLSALTLVPAAFAVNIDDNFESGSKPASFWEGNYDSLLSSTLAKAGNRSLAFRFDGSANGGDAFAELRFRLPQRMTEVYVEYDLYIPENYYHRRQSNIGHGSDNNKSLVQLWSGSYGAVASNVYVGLEQWPTGDGGSTPSIRTGSNHIDTGHTSVGGMEVGKEIIRVPEDLGKWRRFKVHVKLSDSGKANGIVEVWRDGELIIKSRPMNNYSPAGNYFDQGYILGWSNSGFSQTTTMYVDNFRLSDTDFTSTTPSPSSPPKPPALTVQALK